MKARTAASVAAAETAPWIQRFARFGYAAKGVVYVLVGLLALQAAIGSGSATDSSGALRTLVDEPFGRALLAAIALGVFGYALWRAYCTIANPEHDGAGQRAYFALTALIYAGLGIEAARLALGNGGDGGESASHWTARLLAQPFGAWIVGGIGAAIILFGIGQLVHAWKAKLDEQLDLSPLSTGTRAWVVRISRFGLAARGVVFSLIGVFLVRAALSFEPARARGVGGALRSLQSQPFGAWLLGTVALGLVAYGSYELIRARYRVIRPHGAGARSGTYIRVERG